METSTKIFLAAAVATVGIAATWSMSDSTQTSCVPNCMPGSECGNWTAMLETIENARLALLDQYQQTCAPLLMSIQEKISQGIPAYNPTGELETKCRQIAKESLNILADFHNVSQYIPEYCSFCRL